MSYVDDDDATGEEWVEDDDSESIAMTCPSCRGEVHEDAQKCPHCGDWITSVNAHSSNKRLRWILVVGLMILLVLAMALF